MPAESACWTGRSPRDPDEPPNRPRNSYFDEPYRFPPRVAPNGRGTPGKTGPLECRRLGLFLEILNTEVSPHFGSRSRYRSLVALGPYLFDAGVLILDGPQDRDSILRVAADAASKAIGDAGSPTDAEALLEALVGRESQSPTGTPEGVAFPHAMVPGLPTSLVVVIRTGQAVNFGQGRPCDLVFAMFGDAEKPWEHVRLLARLARITGRADARSRLREAQDPTSLLSTIHAEDAANA